MERIIYIAISLLFTSACANDMATRTTYETLENIRMQQCARDFSANCSDRESYNDYSRKRDEAVK